MRHRIGIVACALAVAAPACSKGEQHAVKVECESTDHAARGPGFCATSLDDFVARHQDVEIDNFSIAVERIGDIDFASLVILYRGYVPRVGDADGSAKN